MAISNPTLSMAHRMVALAGMAVVIGLIAAPLALAFVESVAWLNDRLLISPRSRVQLQDSSLLIAATLLVPTLGGLAVGWMLRHLSPLQRPLGPADAIRAVQLREAPGDMRSGVVSTAAAALSLGCGASVGQYGPMVYLGSLIGELAARLKLAVPNLRAIAIACGVAAAIATAFNAPIAGLVFAHEVVLRHYSLQAFAPTTVASATGFVVADVVFAREPLFLVEFGGVQHSYEFALFALLGLLCGLLAVVFMRAILAAAAWARASRIPALLRPACAGFAVGVVALGLPDVLGIGQEVLRFATIEGAFEPGETALLVAAKIALTAICLGFGFAGGVFSPALLIGILFGALFWSLLDLIGLSSSGVTVYAICAMMALASPVIGAPLTTILIVFELTRNYDLTVAAMVSVVFANLLAYRIFGRSLFDVQLADGGVDLSLGRSRLLLQQARVADRELARQPRFDAGQTAGEVAAALREAGRGEAPVVDAGETYLGMFRLQDADEDPARPVRALLRTDAPCFDRDTSLWRAMNELQGFVGEAVPVIERDSGRLIGTITEAEIISAYLEVVHDLRREENASL